MTKTIKINITGTSTTRIEELQELQGTLKKISPQNLKKLCESMKRRGFNNPIFIWNNNILDGHQRLKALKKLLGDGYSLVNAEGLKTNLIPVVHINAKDRSEAAELIFEYNSQYGDFDDINGFIKDFSMDLDSAIDSLNIPELYKAIKPVKTGSVVEVDRLARLTVTCPKCGHEFQKKHEKK